MIKKFENSITISWNNSDNSDFPYRVDFKINSLGFSIMLDSISINYQTLADLIELCYD